MTSQPFIRRPILVPHAVFRWDELRSEHQIVYPEGMLVLNESGAHIVKLCDGRLREEVIAQLQAEVQDDDVAGDVNEFLARLADKGLLREAES